MNAIEMTWWAGLGGTGRVTHSSFGIIAPQCLARAR